MSDDVNYIVSKLFWFVFQPINFLILMCLLGSVLLFTRWVRIARWVLVTSALVLAVISFTPVGLHSLNSIEVQYDQTTLPKHVDGILVLGGSVDWAISKGRGSIELGNAGDRIIQSLVLANKYPNAKYVYTGHQGRKLDDSVGRPVDLKQFIVSLGIESERVFIEDKSRNTHENVRFSYDFIKPAHDEEWVVITSAFHMPRALKLFDLHGWEVTPWVSDYRSPGREGHMPWFYDTTSSIANINIFVKEFIGSLVADWR